MRRAGRMSLGFLLAAVGCSEGAAPRIDSVAGNYRAITFTAEEAGGLTNYLGRGGFINLWLSREGTTTGSLFVPRGASDGTDFSADLTGTWTLVGKTVTFDQAADTLLRDMAFTVEQDRLTAERFFGNVKVRVVLAKH